jgi:TRAP-type C4-dicarboxylate transport system permease small subunit
MNILLAVDHWLASAARAMRVVATAILVLMLFLNLINMVLRLLHQSEINQIVPWTELLFVWMSFLGFAAVHHQKRDIVVDYIVRRLALAGQLAARILTDALVIVLFALALSQVPKIIDLQSGIINMVGLPRYFLSLPFFIAAALILIDALVDLAMALHGRERPIDVPAEVEIDG